MRYKYMLFFMLLLLACGKKRDVAVSFYYWKTSYQNDPAAKAYLQALQVQKLYVRICDVVLDDFKRPVPQAAIQFKQPLPDELAIVPVVFIENKVFIGSTSEDLDHLASNVMRFVRGKVAQSGQKLFREIQIDCDWTVTSKAAYFKFLRQLKSRMGDIKLSATLRLHQLKSQTKMGIPPVDQVLLMCYNMGNLRKYGNQNSILSLSELAQYANQNLGYYHLPMNVALPLFSWSAVFRNQAFVGISYRLNQKILNDRALFARQKNGLYLAQIDLPEAKIKKGDEVRYESSDLTELKETATYLGRYLSEKPLNLVFYHLDRNIVNHYPTYELEKIRDLLH